MQPAKDTVREVLERLPDDCSLEDVMYHLYVVGSVRKGLADAESGSTIKHQEAMQQLRERWIAGREK